MLFYKARLSEKSCYFVIAIGAGEALYWGHFHKTINMPHLYVVRVFFPIFFLFLPSGSFEHELQHLQNKHAGNAEKGIYLLWVYGNCSRTRRRNLVACRAGSKFPSLLMGLISMQGHYQGDTAATVHLPARGASLPKQFHTPWKLSGLLRSNTPRQSETWNEIKRKNTALLPLSAFALEILPIKSWVETFRGWRLPIGEQWGVLSRRSRVLNLDRGLVIKKS